MKVASGQACWQWDPDCYMTIMCDPLNSVTCWRVPSTYTKLCFVHRRQYCNSSYATWAAFPVHSHSSKDNFNYIDYRYVIKPDDGDY